MLRLHLQRHPGTATEYMLLGVALSESGEGLMALQTLEQAVALEPDNPAEDAAPDASLQPASILADEIMRREREKTPKSMIAVLAILALGLIGLLAWPYVPFRVGL